nr:uncharacterized protein LOC111984749 [Quercus suber]
MSLFKRAYPKWPNHRSPILDACSTVVGDQSCTVESGIWKKAMLVLGMKLLRFRMLVPISCLLVTLRAVGVTWGRVDNVYGDCNQQAQQQPLPSLLIMQPCLHPSPSITC